MLHSYFKFLSRNKAYTAIDVLGLALSFMFSSQLVDLRRERNRMPDRELAHRALAVIPRSIANPTKALTSND
ncbi:MAG: hypothetical protein LUD17_10150 [Bacteroidales bacterium]|nr:hypothetical protein [Bacteroidales bacterium]